jgi:hypothetical protein
LAVWRIDQPTAKLKSANIILSHSHTLRAQKAIEVTWWVWSLGSKLVVTRSIHYYCIPIFKARFRFLLSLADDWTSKNLEKLWPCTRAGCSIGGSSTREASHSPSVARSNSAIRQIKIRQYLCFRWLRPIQQI